MAEISNQTESVTEKLTSFFRGVRSEWGKITWPSKQQVVVETIYVIVIVAVFTTMILLMDSILQWILYITHLSDITPFFMK